MTDVQPISQPQIRINEAEKTRQTRAVWISAVISISFAAISLLVYLQNPSETASNIWTITASSLVAIISGWSFWLARRRQTTSAGFWLLGIILILSLSAPVIAHGQGIAVGALIVVLGISITASMLPSQYAVRGNTLSLLVGAAVVALDQTIPDMGLPSNPIYTYFSIVITILFAGVILRQFNEFTLRTKLVIAFTVVTVIPLTILELYNTYTTAQILRQQSRDQLTTLSSSMVERFDNFFTQEIRAINTESKQSALVNFMLLPPQQRENSPEKNIAEKALQTLQRKNIIFIDSYGILDTSGKNILDTSSEDLGRNEGRYDYFTKVIETGAPYMSNVLFIEEGEESIYFSAPIKDPANRIIGVLRVEYHATILQSIAHAVAPNNSNIIVSLVDTQTYLRLAYTGNRDRLFKSYKPFSTLELAALQAENKMPPGTPEEVLAGTDVKIVDGIDNLNETPFFDAYSGSLGSEAVNTGLRLKTQPWIALVRESYASNTRTLEEQTRTIILLSLGLIGTGILLALIGAQVLAAPLVSLTKVAEQIASGDFNARAHINTLDEIGTLAASFNRMTDELNSTLNTLEERVTERTLDLEIAQQQTQKRADELQSVSEISRIITSEQKMEILLPLITRLVSEQFGHYHTGIFLLDETNQFAVLQAANSEGGQRMLQRGHRLELGSGIVGYVAKAGVYRIALDVGRDATYFNNPDMPATHSEMALPLKIRGRTIGVLDVQSEKTNAFTETDAKNLSILADQISISLENARLFERTQQALNEMQALYRQNLQESWASFSMEETLVGYEQTIKGGRKLTTPVEGEDIREVINRGTVMVWNSDENGQDPVIIVPIKLRGQVIGTLKVKAPVKDRAWTSDEINLAQAISERLSIALENARLIQESQRQVIKQQTIRDMTEKISTSINLKNVLQTAVEELGRVIPGSEVVLKLSPKEKDKQDKE